MGSKYSPLDKEKIVLGFKGQDLKLGQYAKKIGISDSAIRNWISAYDESGLVGLVEDEELRTLLKKIKVSKKDQTREIIRLRIENERLKKGYVVKGGGNKKEFATINAKNSKSSKNSPKNTQ